MEIMDEQSTLMMEVTPPLHVITELNNEEVDLSQQNID